MLAVSFSQNGVNQQALPDTQPAHVNSPYKTSTNVNQSISPQPTGGSHTCKSHELTKKHYEEQGVWDDFKQEYQLSAEQMRYQTSQNKTQGNTISVIFHVVHEGEAIGTGTNLSNADIMAVYDELVEDYSLNNADAGNARSAFGFTPVDVGIDFCLAKQDPNGNALPEFGVTRFQTSKTYFDPDVPADENAMKSAPFGSPIWDRNDYMNVWICDITNGATFGVAGYAYRPGVSYLPSSSIDGIVIDYNIGTNPNSNVLTHEVGHYLGLDHTWGGSGSCGSDDGFSDTPNTEGPSNQNTTNDYLNSCSGSQETCTGTQTQYENYMDYANCTVMFTTEQAAYMNTILSGIRGSLLLSPGCDIAGPPVSDFTSSPSSPVIIPTSGTVIFEDLSNSSPTSWAWTISGVAGVDWAYTGGTSSTNQDPQVTFYNIGNYDVSLVASNGFGAGTTELKNTYVQVVAPSAGTACDTLRNYDPATEGVTAYLLDFGAPWTDWGYLPGHGGYDETGGGTAFGITSYAEQYTAASTAEVRRVIIPIFQADDESGGGTVVMNVHSDGAGVPGTVVASEIINISDMNAGAYNTFDFTTPASVTGNFWVSFDLSYLATQDTVIFGLVDFTDRAATTNANTMFMEENSTWGEPNTLYGATWVTSLYMDVLLSNGADPVADFQFSEAAVCIGGDITVNASGSSNVTNYDWYQTDDPYTTTIASNSTAGTTFNFAGAAGDYQIFLFADGSCKSDNLVLPVTVYPTITATVTGTHTSCGLNNGDISITAAAGGDGTNYEYSLDGVNYQAGATFSNLPDGAYTVYIRTTGDACEVTSAVTINASSGTVGTVTAAAAICPSGSTTLTATGGGTYEWYDGTTLVSSIATYVASPTSSTQYTVEITNGGCTDVQFSNVTVDALDDASFSFFDFCDGSANSAVSIATSGGVFSFNPAPGDGATINTTTGEISNETLGTTYSVQYSVTANCPNTNIESVTVNAIDDASFTTSDFCAGSTNAVTGIGTTGGIFTYDGSDASSINSSTGVISNGVVGTSYDIVYSTPVGICQTISAPQTVTVNVMPTVDAGLAQTLCSADGVTLTATNPNSATITWDNSVVDGVSFTQAVGSVTYEATATLAGCVATDVVSVTVNLSPSVDGGADQSVCVGDDASLLATNPDGATISWNNSVTDGLQFTPAMGAPTYTVSAVLGSCTSTDDVEIVVNIVPSVDAGTDQTLCEGIPVTLTATNPDGGVITWSNSVVDGVAFTPSAGLVTYVATSTIGACSSQDQVVVDVTPGPGITAVIIHDSGTTNGEIDVTITGGTVVSTDWDNSATTEDLTGLSAGTYTITVELDNGCTSVESFIVLNTVGVDVNETSELSIYPNPTDGEFSINLEGEYTVSIMDARGRLIITKSATDNTEINLSDYESGVYFVKVQVDGNIIVKKVILK